jgi:hypothetical protein
MPIDLIAESMRPLADRIADWLAHDLIDRSDEDRERVINKLASHHVQVLRFGDRVAVFVGDEPVTVVAADQLA